MPADDLNDLARALGRLRPAPAALDRDALMFRAGYRAGLRGLGWPIAVAAASLLALAFGALWLTERGSRRAPTHAVYVPPRHDVVSPEPQGVEVEGPGGVPGPQRPDPLVPSPPESAPQQPAPRPSSARPPAPAAAASKQEVEERLIRWGLDGLPQTTAAPARPASVDELLRSF
jgi:hypothetical protein